MFEMPSMEHETYPHHARRVALLIDEWQKSQDPSWSFSSLWVIHDASKSETHMNLGDFRNVLIPEWFRSTDCLQTMARFLDNCWLNDEGAFSELLPALQSAPHPMKGTEFVHFMYVLRLALTLEEDRDWVAKTFGVQFPTSSSVVGT